MAPASPLTARHREIQLRPPTLKTPFYARPACRDTRAPPLLSPLKVARHFGISALQDLPENSWNSWNIIGWVHGREKEKEREEFSVNLKTDLSVEARKIFITLFLDWIFERFCYARFLRCCAKSVRSDRQRPSLRFIAILNALTVLLGKKTFLETGYL